MEAREERRQGKEEAREERRGGKGREQATECVAPPATG